LVIWKGHPRQEYKAKDSRKEDARLRKIEKVGCALVLGLRIYINALIEAFHLSGPEDQLCHYSAQP
jgi:hypothetical protein